VHVGGICFPLSIPRYHDQTLAAKKARILINALVDCAKAGIKPSAVTKKMLWGVSLYLECGSFQKENWRTYQRASEAAKRVRASGDKDWKSNVTFEHGAPAGRDVSDAFG
jgi:hypothetical protein